MDHPRVSILIVTYNSAAFTTRCFEALLAQTCPEFEVIVFDNASSDGGPILPQDPRFRLVQSDRNIGFAAGNNQASEHARALWLATLNPDAFAEPQWLDNALQAVSKCDGATMLGSLQLDASDPTRLDGAGDCYHAFGIAWRALHGRSLDDAPSTGEVFGPCAAAAFYRTDAFRAAGGFDEAFFCYHEDVDLAARLRLMGGRCVQSAEARVHHIGSAVSGRNSDFSVYHGMRNRIWTFFQIMPWPLLLLLVMPHLATNVFLCWRAPHSIRVASWRGLWDGLRDLPRVWFIRRRQVQQLRRISSFEFSRTLTWSSKRLFNNDHDVRLWRTNILPA